jgi:hypothetical protein
MSTPIDEKAWTDTFDQLRETFLNLLREPLTSSHLAATALVVLAALDFEYGGVEENSYLIDARAFDHNEFLNNVESELMDTDMFIVGVSTGSDSFIHVTMGLL